MTTIVQKASYTKIDRNKPWGKAIREAWDAGKDFQILGGAYISKRDITILDRVVCVDLANDKQVTVNEGLI